MSAEHASPAAIARAVLDEAGASGLALDSLPGNSAKIRLMLDLAAQVRASDRPVRILDVGAGGRFNPFNLWEPFLPLAASIELTGVDVANLEPTRARAAEIGFPVELREGSANRLLALFGKGSFDAVVSTQVLEHLPDWTGALREMRDVLRDGGRLYVTCDSGDLDLDPLKRARLAGKRAYWRLGERVPAVKHVLAGAVSGEWERGPTRAELGTSAEALGLRVHRLRHYALRDLKDSQRRADAAARLLWLAYEEALDEGDESLYRILYLDAERESRDGQRVPSAASQVAGTPRRR